MSPLARLDSSTAGCVSGTNASVPVPPETNRRSSNGLCSRAVWLVGWLVACVRVIFREAALLPCGAGMSGLELAKAYPTPHSECVCVRVCVCVPEHWS